jgi:hypothetical protein
VSDDRRALTTVHIGGVVARRAQDRQWLRDKQLDAYEELLRRYSRFAMELKRAHEVGRSRALRTGRMVGRVAAEIMLIAGLLRPCSKLSLAPNAA